MHRAKVSKKCVQTWGILACEQRKVQKFSDFFGFNIMLTIAIFAKFGQFPHGADIKLAEKL
jgi:hypothetical protein